MTISASNQKLISIVIPVFNEKENIPLIYDRISKVMAEFPHAHEIIVADNNSNDGTKEVLRELASKDKSFKVIFNSSNFGAIRSHYHAFLEAQGDAVIIICADMQEPPELIRDFILKWEEGFEVVVGVKPESKENPLIFLLRKAYYRILDKFSDIDLLHNFTGFGLYDKKFMHAIRQYSDAYPYFRGLVSEIGFKQAQIPYLQNKREHGTTKMNILRLYDYAMTGFVNHSKLPLRLASLTGFLIAGFSFIVAFVYLVLKLCFWTTFSMGQAPLVTGLFFLSAVQLIFIGIVGEYVGAIFTQVRNSPHVIECERLNFDSVGDRDVQPD